ncbi:hypothetical protein J2X72_003013 [Phyllobacterium sp. 1468]|uniref:hypothetical protein n=1 Tax=Phyllobacterium sp. 1468 TaxID=2817759 RepID=UPI0028545CC6|nr:hypothetical protein [Phyllobacterium sp. 1468]MDR6634213.1 hypothetical protein [Phyllobacterium sp. 1468]
MPIPEDFNADEYYGLSEFLSLCGFSRQHFHERYQKRGKGPQVTVRKGKYLYIQKASANAFIAKHISHQARRATLRPYAGKEGNHYVY